MSGFHAPRTWWLDKSIFPLANSHSRLPVMGCGTHSTLGDIWGCFPRDFMPQRKEGRSLVGVPGAASESF